MEPKEIRIEDTEITKIPTAGDILDKGKISITTKPEEVVDTPTPLVAGTKNKFFGIAVIVVVISLIVWYFFLRRK